MTIRGGASLTDESLGRLLARLGPDREMAGQEYLAIRRKLVEMFQRRGVVMADALADETLDRVGRKLQGGAVVENVRGYCHGVGFRVLLEWRSRQAREAAAFSKRPGPHPENDSEETERRISCLERCLRGLPAESRDLIVAYYEGDGAGHIAVRQRLAQTLSLSLGSLKTRAYRVRLELAECLKRCLDQR